MLDTSDIFRLIPDRADEEPCLLEKTIQKNEDELRDRVHGGHPIMIDDALEEHHKKLNDHNDIDIVAVEE